MDKRLEATESHSSVRIHDELNNLSTLTLPRNDFIQNNLKNSYLDSQPYILSHHRNKASSTTDVGALIHILKSSLGSGILAMPGAFKNAGLFFGIIGTIFIGIICTYCVHLLVYCSQTLSVRVKKPGLGFAETAETAFRTGPHKYRKWAPWARSFVHTSLFTTYYLGTTVYIIFIAESFKQVIEDSYDINLNIRLYLLALAVPLVPLGIIRTLRILVPFSAIATSLILFGLFMTVYYTLRDLPSFEERPYISSPTKWPLFLSTILFAMEGIGTVLPIENSMQNPEHFLGCPGVLNIAMSVVVTLFGSIGFCGYLKFGDATLASVTLNLGKTVLAQTVKLLVALSILFTYGLQFTVPSEIMWYCVGPYASKENQKKLYYIMRGLMIMGTVILAIILPQLSPFISLVGAICFSTLGLFCPAMIDTITVYEEGFGFLKWKLIKNITITILAVVFLVSGSYASILEIIETYS